MTQRLDTLDLVGDGDDLAILHDIEAVFGTSIRDHESASARTVGDLHRIVAEKLKRGPTTACFSQIAFHWLRKVAIKNGVALRLRPGDELDVLFVGCRTRRDHRRRWSEIERMSGLALPPLEAPGTDRPSIFKAAHPRLAGAFSWSSAAAVLCSALGTLGGWIVGLATAAIVGGIWFGPLRSTIPARIRTIGDLAEEAAGYSFKMLYAEKGSCQPNDVWRAVVATCRASTGFRDEIGQNTSFFAADAARP